MNIRMTLILCIAQAAIGCGAAPAGDSDTETTAQDLVVGNWSAPSTILAPGAFTGPISGLPVCRVPYDGGNHPGKYWNGQCLFEWGGHGYAAGPSVPGRPSQVSQFGTLVNNGRMSWFRLTNTVCGPYGCANQLLPIPQNAIDGGPSGYQSGQAPLPVCAVNYGGMYHPGKWWAGGCNIEYGGSGYHLVGTGYDPYIAVSN